MKVIKKAIERVFTFIAALGFVFVILAWLTTFLSATFGLAIKTFLWFTAML